METQVIHIDPTSINPKDEATFPAALDFPVSLLHQGHVVAMPTETVYGLAANALNGTAVSRIFAAKNRPADNPLITHVSSLQMVQLLVQENFYEILMNPEKEEFKDSPQLPFARNARTLINHFWPGPLTLLLPKKDDLSNLVTANQPTVGVRMPSHPIALALIAKSGLPLAAPSANSSGNPSPTEAKHVIKDLNGKIPCVIDGGNSKSGIESTVVDIMRVPPIILRPGGVTLEQIRELIPSVQVFNKEFKNKQMEDAPSTPGMKYRHYSPMAKVILFEGSHINQNGSNGVYSKNDNVEGIRHEINAKLEEYAKSGVVYGLVKTHKGSVYENFKEIPENPSAENRRNIEVQLGDEEHLDQVAQGLFKVLRELGRRRACVEDGFRYCTSWERLCFISSRYCQRAFGHSNERRCGQDIGAG